MSPDTLPSQPEFQPTVDYMFGEKPGREIVHTGTIGLVSKKSAATEMEARAGLSSSCSRPALLLLVKYPAGIRLSWQMVDRDVHRLTAALGLNDNQIAFAAHQKNGNYDLHMVANIVESTGKCTRIPFVLPTLYRVCAAICRERSWEMPPNKYNKEPRSENYIRKTKATYYSHERGEIPWVEAVAHFIRSAQENSRDWPEFLRNISEQGLSIKLTSKTYNDGVQRPILTYSLVDYPHIKGNATSISHEAKYESLTKKFGELPSDYLSYLPGPNIGMPPRTNNDLYSSAGRVLETCVTRFSLPAPPKEVAALSLVVPPRERELIIARAKLREAWRFIRAETSREFHEPRARLWAAERQVRFEETQIRRKKKKDELRRIRTLPTNERLEARFQLVELLHKLYRQQRKEASRRWKDARQRLEKEFPLLRLDFVAFVLKEISSNPRARIVHLDHVARGLVGPEPNGVVGPRQHTVNPISAPKATTPLRPQAYRQGPVQT